MMVAVDVGFDAIVLAGGSGRRLGGVDKASLEVGGVRLLDRVLAAVASAERVILVGPLRGQAGVIECREDPPGGGPVAGLAAGVIHARADVVVVLAVDLPAIAPAIGPLLRALEPAATDASVLVGVDGRQNYLAVAWRRSALVRTLAAVGSANGAAMRALYADVVVAEVADLDGWGADCDTVADLDAARQAAIA